MDDLRGGKPVDGPGLGKGKGKGEDLGPECLGQVGGNEPEIDAVDLGLGSTLINRRPHQDSVTQNWQGDRVPCKQQ